MDRSIRLWAPAISPPSWRCDAAPLDHAGREDALGLAARGGADLVEQAVERLAGPEGLVEDPRLAAGAAVLQDLVDHHAPAPDRGQDQEHHDDLHGEGRLGEQRPDRSVSCCVHAPVSAAIGASERAFSREPSRSADPAPTPPAKKCRTVAAPGPRFREAASSLRLAAASAAAGRPVPAPPASRMRVEQRPAVAPDPLAQHQARARGHLDGRLNAQEVVEAGRREVVRLDPADREDGPDRRADGSGRCPARAPIRSGPAR